MANSLSALVPTIFSLAFMSLRKQAAVINAVNTDFDSEVAEKGTTITMTLPSSASATAVSPAITPPANTDHTPTSVALVLNKWYESAFYLTDKEQKDVLSDRFRGHQIDAAVKALVEQMASDVYALYKDIYGYAGTAATTPFASDTSAYTAVRKVLNDQQAPLDPRYMILDTAAEANALGLRAFQDASYGGGEGVIMRGQIGEKMGALWAMDQLVPTHTAGTLSNGSTHTAKFNGGGSPQTVGATTMNIDETTLTGTVVTGDIFTVAGDTQPYVVVTGGTASSNALAGVTFLPAAAVAWADDAVITFKDTHVSNLLFHRDAFALAIRPLSDEGRELGNIVEVMTDPVTGIPLRLEVSRQHKQTRWSLDVLYGVKTARAELAARLAG